MVLLHDGGYQASTSMVVLSELIGLMLRNELLEWERIYDTVRLHQAPGYVTPLKFLEQWKEKQRKDVMCY